MSQIFNSLKNLISPEMISKASTLVEEDNSKVSSAVTAIIPSLLGVFLKRGNTPQLKNILEEAGNLNILSNTGSIFCDNVSHDQQNIGDNFLQNLLGDKAADFSNAISNHTNITKVATNRLVSMIAPVVAGFLGNKLTKEKWTMSNLMNEISQEKGSFAGLIPVDLVKSFGLSSILNTNTTDNTNTRKVTDVPEEPKKSGWLKWLLLLLLLLLLFFWWRSCRDTTGDRVVDRTTIRTDSLQRDTVVRVPTTPNPVPNRTITELTLPNGVTLNAYQGGIEDQIIRFLQSDDYRNASANDLRDRWFEFDNIDFRHGSSTELTDNSKPQLDNVINILKYFDDVKVEIGANADKTGSDEANMKLSQERANTIKSMMVRGGIKEANLTATGFGEKNAEYSEDAPESDRVKDRNISLRFIK